MCRFFFSALADCLSRQNTINGCPSTARYNAKTTQYRICCTLTVTRSSMKLFRTSSANIVQDCQNFFRLLPISNLIDKRTARFLEDFTINEKYVCRLFVRNAQCSLVKIFSMYSHDIVSTCNMRSVISDMFFG